jgi:hypothetical protein
MKKKYIFVWFDGDIKRHYFSSKSTFNIWLNDFVKEYMTTPHNWQDSNSAGKTVVEIKKYFSSPLFLDKVELDV